MERAMLLELLLLLPITLVLYIERVYAHKMLFVCLLQMKNEV